MLFKIFITSFVSGMLGAMGFGSGTVLIVWLTAFMSYDQLRAQGVNLIFFIPCACISFLLLNKKGFVNKRVSLPIAAGGAVGVSAGQLILPQIPTEYLSKLFGVFIIILSLRQLLGLKKSQGLSH